MNRRELVGVITVLLAAGTVAYLSGGPPSLFGHSPDEIKLVFKTYSTDCTNNVIGASCSASCSASEKAVSGNCITDFGYAFGRWGVTDATTNQRTWDCTDNSHGQGVRLFAQVICLDVG